MFENGVCSSVELWDDVVFKTRHLIPLRGETENLPGPLDAWQRGDLRRGGPCIAGDPGSVEVVINGCFHDDLNVAGLGEQYDGLCRGFIDFAHQLIQLHAGLWSVLGKVPRQDVSEFNAEVFNFSWDFHNFVTAVLPVLVVTSHNGHCFPVKLLHKSSNGLCLMFIARYCSQESGELQLPA